MGRYKKIVIGVSNLKPVANVVQGNLFRPVVRRFVAGDSIKNGLDVVRKLNNEGIRATLDNLGEEVHDKKSAKKVLDEYLLLLDKIYEKKLQSGISIKLTQLGLVIDPKFALKNLREVLKRAKKYKSFVRVDMEGKDYTQSTINLFRSVLSDYREYVGIVMQAYLYRTPKDVEKMIKDRAHVRLCKGAYAEPASVAYPKKSDVDKNYESLMKKLLGKGNKPAIATHDEKMIETAKKFVKSHKISLKKFEFQMLYGIRHDLQKKLAGEGYNIRVYVPYGTEWYPYLSRRIGERPANLGFIANSITSEALNLLRNSFSLHKK